MVISTPNLRAAHSRPTHPTTGLSLAEDLKRTHDACLNTVDDLLTHSSIKSGESFAALMLHATEKTCTETLTSPHVDSATPTDETSKEECNDWLGNLATHKTQSSRKHLPLETLSPMPIIQKPTPPPVLLPARRSPTACSKYATSRICGSGGGGSSERLPALRNAPTAMAALGVAGLQNGNSPNHAS